MVYGGKDGPPRTRWGPPDAKLYLPGVPPLIPNNLGAEEMDALLIRVRIEEITMKLTSARIDVDNSDNRSPSPPPRYDSMGKRVNTREMREKDKMAKERHSLIQFASKISPTFRPPQDYRPNQIKRELKIYVPTEKYPEYNFIGLILGPRGLTQKQMERESGAKIAIRGKGSVKDGRGRLGANYHEEEPLYVLITADNDDSIAKAESMVKKLLVPVDESKNEHKRHQLRKLAEINGTLRDNLWEGGDERRDMRFSDTGVVQCLHCGERSHPTRDCPVKGKRKGTGGAASLDSEVASFFSELTDAPAKKDTEWTLEELECTEFRELFDLLVQLKDDPHKDINVNPASVQAPVAGTPWLGHQGGGAPQGMPYPPQAGQYGPPGGQYGPPAGQYGAPSGFRGGNPSPYGPQ